MTELVQVRIKGIVTTSRYGTLSSGDTLRTDAAFAKHLVEDCSAAEYVAEKATVTAKNAEKPKSKAAKKTVAEPAVEPVVEPVVVEPVASVAESTEETTGPAVQADTPQE
jgi:hypothetical protein